MNRALIFLMLALTLMISAGTINAQQDVRGITLDSLLNVKVNTAAKYEQTQNEAPASVSILTSEDIERFGYRTLEEALATVRGFYTSYDRNYNYLGVRGFSRPTDYNDRILLLINGHTTNESFYGSASIGTELALIMESVERIEIVRGPGSALYGNGAMFATINIITKKGNTVDGTQLSAGIGTFGRKQSSLMIGKKYENGLDLLISGSWFDLRGQDLYFQEFDAPATNNGIAEGLDWDRNYSLFSSLNYKGFTLMGSGTSREKGIPTASYDVVFNDNRAKTLDEAYFAELKYNATISNDKDVVARTYYDSHRYRGTYPNTVLSFDAADGTTFGGEVQFLWDVASNNRFTIGGEYKNNTVVDYRLWDENTIYFNKNFPFSLFSVYIQDEYQVTENLKFTLGIRRDAYSSLGSSTTPRAAIVFNPYNTSTVKLLYGEAFRAPNPFEANYEDPIAGYKTSGSLQPEKIRTTELVWEQRLTGELFSTVSLYDYHINDLIDQTLDPADSLKQFQNLHRIRAHGVELELNARMENGLRGYASYTLQQALDAAVDQQLTNSPEQMFKLGLSFPAGAHFHIAAEAQHMASRTTVYGKNLDPFFVMNMNLSTNPVFGSLKGTLLIRNVLNNAYQSPGGFEHRQEAIPQDGRDITVKFEFKF